MTIQITFEYEAVEDALNALRRLAGEEASAAIEPAAPVSTPAEDEKLQPSGEQAVSPVAADPKPVSTRPVRADKGLGRAPYGPHPADAKTRRPKLAPAAPAAPAFQVVDGPDASPAATLAADAAGTPNSEITPLPGAPTFDSPKVALTAVFNSKGRDVSMELLHRFGLLRLSELPTEMERQFVVACGNAMITGAA